MEDLFSIEQKIYDDAVSYIKELKNGAELDIEKLDEFVLEYGKLLKQMRSATEVSASMTGNLVTSKIHLIDRNHQDELTGIYDRRYLEENLNRIIKSFMRSGDRLSVIMINIDFFKIYNDTYGHSYGDACLKSVAHAIAGCLPRADDFVARYGGEEFVVVLPNTDNNGARIMANKLLEAVRKLNIPHEKSDVADCVTVSIGATTNNVKSGQLPEEYIRRADMALYISKKNGRNCYTYID